MRLGLGSLSERQSVSAVRWWSVYVCKEFSISLSVSCYCPCFLSFSPSLDVLVQCLERYSEVIYDLDIEV